MADLDPTIVTAVLKQAQQALKDNPDWDAIRALAEATTTALRASTLTGFEVFHAVRNTVVSVLPAGETLQSWSDSTPSDKAIGLLGQAMLVVGS